MGKEQERGHKEKGMIEYFHTAIMPFFA